MSNTKHPAGRAALELTQKLEQRLESPNRFSSLEKDLIKETIRKIYVLIEEIPIEEESSAGLSFIDTFTEDQGKQPESVLQQSLREQVLATMSAYKPAESTETTVSGTIETETTPEIKSRTQVPDKPVQYQQPAVVVEAQPVPQSENQVHISTIESSTKFQGETGTLAEKYKATETLAEKIGKSEAGGVRLEEKLKHQRLGDLRSSIGINEHFHFTNEFFGGNQQAYMQFIDHINTLHEFTEAMAFTVKSTNGRPPTNGLAEAQMQFEELLRRRFMA